MEPSVTALIHAAILEDVGAGDVTSAYFIPESSRSRAEIVAREIGVVSGAGIAVAVFKEIDPTLEVEVCIPDGGAFERGDILMKAAGSTRYGSLYFGSTSPSMTEALDRLESDGLHLDAMRLRAFPFPKAVEDFILSHDKVFVVEQNRDGQLRTMLTTELGIDPARLVAVLHYDGTPITANFILGAIRAGLAQHHVVPLERAVS